MTLSSAVLLASRVCAFGELFLLFRVSAREKTFGHVRVVFYSCRCSTSFIYVLCWLRLLGIVVLCGRGILNPPVANVLMPREVE